MKSYDLSEEASKVRGIYLIKNLNEIWLEIIPENRRK